MKSIIFYFSGTGNTELVVKKWQSECHSFPLEIKKIEEVNNETIDLSEYDKIGIAYPIHAFNAPRNVLKFAKKIVPSEMKKRVYIIMVSGEYMTVNHSSALKLGSILKKRNYFIESDYHYIMPYNMIFRHTELRAYQMFKTMNDLVVLDVKEYFEENKPHHLKKHRFIRPFIWALRIEQVFAPINGKTYRIKEKKCIKCMKCVNSCPTNNIEYKDGKFVFHGRCICCTRCSFNCPTDAFKIGLLNGWRVNKPYKFAKPEVEEVDKHPRYCKKSYIRYYQEAEERLKNAQN